MPPYFKIVESAGQHTREVSSVLVSRLAVELGRVPALRKDTIESTILLWP